MIIVIAHPISHDATQYGWFPCGAVLGWVGVDRLRPTRNLKSAHIIKVHITKRHNSELLGRQPGNITQDYLQSAFFICFYLFAI
jgi:hypothetical protein